MAHETGVLTICRPPLGHPLLPLAPPPQDPTLDACGTGNESECVQAVERSALDKFPDAKKAASDVAVFLVEACTPPPTGRGVVPQGLLREPAAALVRAFAAALAHQQQRIRQSALQVPPSSAHSLC